MFQATSLLCIKFLKFWIQKIKNKWKCKLKVHLKQTNEYVFKCIFMLENLLNFFVSTRLRYETHHIFKRVIKEFLILCFLFVKTYLTPIWNKHFYMKNLKLMHVNEKKSCLWSFNLKIRYSTILWWDFLLLYL